MGGAGLQQAPGEHGELRLGPIRLGVIVCLHAGAAGALRQSERNLLLCRSLWRGLLRSLVARRLHELGDGSLLPHQGGVPYPVKVVAQVGQHALVTEVGQDPLVALNQDGLGPLVGQRKYPGVEALRVCGLEEALLHLGEAGAAGVGAAAGAAAGPRGIARGLARGALLVVRSCSGGQGRGDGAGEVGTHRLLQRPRAALRQRRLALRRRPLALRHLAEPLLFLLALPAGEDLQLL
mmetsp:Transcript_50652/g.156798  ORF Transcript_50652/g.156798 Transcript_50652/m.156798 type:complete len:236 (+) Transcript_50652:415-1122(+)